MKRKIFIDLEGTLIDDWENINFLREKAEWIAHQLSESDEISIFSFAIWNHQDVERFDLFLRKPLETFFKRPIFTVLTVSEIRRTVCRFRKLSIDPVDFTSIFPKHLAFVEFIRATERCGEFLLFDDMVEDWKIEVGGKNILIFKV